MGWVVLAATHHPTLQEGATLLKVCFVGPGGPGGLVTGFSQDLSSLPPAGSGGCQGWFEHSHPAPGTNFNPRRL